MKKLVTGILCLVMLLLQTTVFVSAKEYSQKFWDVPKDHWAFEYIAELVERDVISGYTDGSFKPEATVSRAEWAKMMVQTAGVKAEDDNAYYNDMQGHWAAKYVNAAKDYLTAFTDGSYRPDQAAVREDVTMALVKLKGYDLNEVDYSFIMGFKDLDSISNVMKPYVALAVQKGLISGYEDNTFRGQGTLTRAQAAVLLQKAFSLGNDNKTVNVSDTEKTPDTQPTTGDDDKKEEDKPHNIAQDSAVMVVATIKDTTYNDDGAYIVTGKQKGKEASYIIYNKDADYATEPKKLAKGDIILLAEADSEGVVNDCRLLFDKSENELSNAAKAGDAKDDIYNCFAELNKADTTSSKFFLKADVKNDEGVWAEAADGINMEKSANYTLVDYTESAKNPEFSKKNPGTSLFSTTSKYATYVFVRIYDGVLTDVVVYRFNNAD